jgi:heme oxygenase
MIHDLLRNGTREHHERAESRLPLLDPALTRERYAHALAALHGFHAPLEARLTHVDWAAVGLDWEARRKAPLLARDLLQLGRSAREVGALPRCDVLPDTASLARALGCAYVLEGATLGGQLVRRHLQRTLALTPESGCAFFAAYGDRVGPMWRDFTARLASAVDHGGCAPDEVLAGARDTFDAISAWLEVALPCDR